MPRSVACWLLTIGISAGVAGQAHAAAYTFSTIDRPGSPVGTTVLYGINDAGTVVGGSAGFGNDSFIDTNGVFTTIAGPQANGSTNARAISNNGLIAGSYIDASGLSVDFLDTNGVFATFDPSNGLTQNTPVSGVNNSGQVIGEIELYGSAIPAIDGFLYANGSSTLLNVPGAIATYPDKINDLGQITGSYSLAQYYNVGAYHVVFGGYFEDIAGVITTSSSPFFSIPAFGDVPGAIPGYTNAYGVNDGGQVVGDYYTYPLALGGYPDMVHGFIATPATAVPEPGTSGLLSLSLAAFGLSVYHRRSGRARGTNPW